MIVVGWIYGVAVVAGVGAVVFTAGVKFERRRAARAMSALLGKITAEVHSNTSALRGLRADTDGGGRDE